MKRMETNSAYSNTAQFIVIKTQSSSAIHSALFKKTMKDVAISRQPLVTLVT